MSKINKVLYNVDQRAANVAENGWLWMARHNIGLDDDLENGGVIGKATTTDAYGKKTCGIAPLDTEGKIPSICLPAYGNISTDGKIGSASGLPLLTTTDGLVTTGAFGTGAGEFASGNHTHLTSISEISFSGESVPIKPGSHYKITAGGTVSYINPSDACVVYGTGYKSPISPGAFLGQHAYCPASKTMYEYLGTERGWLPIAGTHHKMIIQIKYLKLNGQTVSRNILCDKQDYTENSGPGESIQFNPIDPYLYAYWYNRGDSFELGKEVSNDPWGDGYPLWITEYQAYKDGNGDWYCTNLNAVRYDRGTLQGKWFNNITDEETGIMYLECQSW